MRLFIMKNFRKQYIFQNYNNIYTITASLNAIDFWKTLPSLFHRVLTRLVPRPSPVTWPKHFVYVTLVTGDSQYKVQALLSNTHSAGRGFT